MLRLWCFGLLNTIIQNNDHKESSRITWHFTARGTLFSSATWLYMGKSLSQNILFYWIDFKKYYKIMHTSSLCMTQECGFSNDETWCYLQPGKILFDSSVHPLWMSADHSFDFVLLIFFFPYLASHSYIPYIAEGFSISVVTYERWLQEETPCKYYLEKQWMALLDYNYKAIKHANHKLQ